ncbi:MAG: ATP synthase F1 subunit delta [Cyanobacteriota bacterium]
MKGSLVSAEIVEPYAEAFMSIAESNNLTERFGDDARSLINLLENSPELREFLNNPVLKPNDQKAVIRQVLGEEAHPYLVNLLMLLVDKRRIMFLEGICKRYLDLLRQKNNIVLAEVTSAKELTEEQRQAVSERVKGMTNAQSVELKTQVDPALLGGVIVRVGSQVLDASLQGQLRRIGMRLATTA